MQNSPRVRAILALAALVAAHPRVTVAWDETEDSAPADAPWKQVLNDDDAKQVAALTARMKDAVKYADAIPWAEQIAEIRARVQGADHWEAADARRRVVTLKDIAAMPAQAQAELAGVRKIAAGASHLESLDQFSEAEPLHRQALAIVTRLLAKGHPLVAENQDSLAMNLSRQSKYADAQSLFELSLEIRRRALGEDHPDTANAYNSLAFNLYYQGKFAAAKLRLEKALQIRRAVLGEDDPVTAMTYNNLAAILNGQGKYAEAEPMSRKVLAIYRRAFGEHDFRTANGYNSLAVNLTQQSRHDEAEPLYRMSLAILRQLQPLDHRQTALGCNNLAVNLQRQGKYSEAETQFRGAISMLHDRFGAEHPDTALASYNLAYNRHLEGDYAAADLLLRNVLVARQRTLGEAHPATASGLNTLAVNLTRQGRHVEAEVTFRRALAIQQKVLGEEHPDTTNTYNGLALNLHAQGKSAQAEALLRQALQVTLNASGAGHADTALLQNNLGFILEKQGKRAQAATLYREALATCEVALGDEHPRTATEYANLANVLNRLGEHVEAESLCRKALAIRRRRLGDRHPDTVSSRTDLAWILNSQGRHVEAQRDWLAAIEGYEAARLCVGRSGLQRAVFAAENSPFLQLAAVEARLNQASDAWEHLEANLARGLFDDISARQARPLDEAERRREADLIGRRGALGQQVADQAEATNDEPAAEERLDELRGRLDAVSAELSDFESDLVEKYGTAAGQSFNAARVQQAIEPDEALVVWVEVPDSETDADPGGDHWAGLLRREGQPVWFKLPGSGPSGAWTSDDRELARRVHRLLVEPGNVANAWQNPARELFALRLFPLVDALTSTESLPAVRRLVVLPSLGMDGVPVETLLAASGRRDYTVSYAPSGTVFAWLREKRAAEPGRLARARRSRLLALGDPAFPPAEAPFGAEPPEHGAYVALVTPGSNAERHALRSGDVLVTYGGAVVSSADELGDLIQRRPLPEKAVAENEANDVALEVWRAGKTMRLTVAAGPLGVQLDKRSAADAVRTERQFGDFLRSTRSDAFQPLPGARREVQAIARLFPGAEMLLGQEASTGRLDELANSGRLGEFDVLHFATHGQLDQRSPLESALVLSCTDPPDSREQDLTGDTIYDGRLTAAHIMRLWKLNADLAVLSACETGLGKYSGGEGFVGFSQALLLAGAQSLVLSQWKVDDTATALLMVRFYENLLGKREGLKGPLSKTEALAESKRWLRELSADEVEKLVADLPAVERVGKATGAPRPAVKSARPFSHPYYWAAFILIGDPE